MHGSGKTRHGADGDDRIVIVPEGTVVLDEDGVVLADLAAFGQEMIAARGGRGGRGNARFATSTRRAPTFAEKGEPGEHRVLRLELRLLADVGLVGFPNAGKSTLIARISAARPKIADYPFTTLTPNLGVVSYDDGSFVVADIPGLVPGASKGKGLGHRFLRHVSRAAVLVFLVDTTAQEREPVDDVEILKKELDAFDPELSTRPDLIVATKIDAGRDVLPRVLGLYPDALAVSAVTGEGINELVGRLVKEVAESRSARRTPTGYVRHVTREDPIRIEHENGAWRVRGRRPERAVATTNMDNEEAVARLQRTLLKMGVEKALQEAGARMGEEVRIGDTAFDFEPEVDDD
jgi:GTP-binding protein